MQEEFYRIKRLPPYVFAEVNRLKADRDKVMKSLGKFGAAETALAPDGLRIAATEGDGRHPNVQVEPAFQRGLFEIQDEGSQLAALMVGAKPGEQVLDLCAGAGGKTLALAATAPTSSAAVRAVENSTPWPADSSAPVRAARTTKTAMRGRTSVSQSPTTPSARPPTDAARACVRTSDMAP